MKKLNIKKFSMFLLISLFLYPGINTCKVKASTKSVARVGGKDRYETSAKVAEANWGKGVENVILASGETYADALSAAPLGKNLDAPILLTKKDELDPTVEIALEKLDPKNVYILGSEGVISKNIRNQIRQYSNVIELYGKDRFETNIAISEYLVQKQGISTSEILVVNGEQSFADGLSIAPIAAAKGKLLLLVSNQIWDCKNASRFIEKYKSSSIVVGNRFMVPDEVYNKLNPLERIKGGQDRYETNLNILERFKGDLTANKVYVANASIAVNGYADALIASGLAGRYKAPLILVNKVGREGTKNAVQYIKENVKTDGYGEAIGGESVIPDSLMDDIEYAIKNKVEIK